LTTILAADVSSYNRHIGIDEAGTADALHAHQAVLRPISEPQGGRLTDTVGDSVLTGLMRPGPNVDASRRHPHDEHVTPPNRDDVRAAFGGAL